MSNYKELTTHGSQSPRKPKQRSTPGVPALDLELPLNHAYVVQEDDKVTGKPGTSMTKIRYDDATDTWAQVPRNVAGMYVFFTTEPEMQHVSFRIKRIIPNKTACYADPI